jgi:long-subunit acyl-CoA synthetase (AMP-forming)
MEGTTKTRVTTLAEALRHTATEHPDVVAVRTVDDSFSITWGELLERVDAVAGGLVKLGLERGDTVALLLSNRPEFQVCDLAVVMAGGTPFSIYPTLSPEQIQYVVSDAGARIAFVETALLPAFLEAKKDLPDLETLIVLDGDPPEGGIRLADVEGTNPDFDGTAACAEVQPDDLLTLIYTSGTTGPPKGVQLTHTNLLSAMTAVEELLNVPVGGRVISWLPAAHIAERGAHHYLPIIFGLTITVCPNPREVVSFLPQVRPSWFFAVPRIWEKLKAGLESMLASQPDEQREQAQAALAAAVKKVQLEQAGEEVPEELAQQVAAADEAMFSKLRETLGLDQVITVNVGAAPTPRDVLEFFHAIGIELSEIWGMSETCGGGTVNPPGKVRIGTVGPPVNGVEIKLAEDGEVLIKGALVMKGYRNLPDKTAETIDEDGWLHTGDIGEFDEEGYLKIVDRKKEIIINAAGKNMSPANIESTIKGSIPLVGQAVTIGDAKPYNTALITLDPDFAPVWASKNGLEGKSLEELASDEKMIAAIQAGIDEANAKLARVEQIKKFKIIPGDWTPGGDELTPTMKLKRKPIAEKYGSEIDELYGS